MPWVLALILALECLEEASKIQKEAKHPIIKIIERGNVDPFPEQRRVVAEALLARRLPQMRPLNKQIEADTSLVTSAAYQFFLDEQLAQGNHLQSDHWRQLTFLSGQGYMLVFGTLGGHTSFLLLAHEARLWCTALPLPHIRELERYAIESVSNEEADTGPMRTALPASLG